MKWALVTLIVGYVAIWQIDTIQQIVLPLGVILLLGFLFYLTAKRIRLLSTVQAKLQVIVIIIVSTGVLVLILWYLINQEIFSLWYYPPIFALLVFSRRVLRTLVNLSITEPQSFGVQSETERGEIVRSKAEKKVADWLYGNDIEYEYEKKIDLHNGETILCDFYLKEENIYVEYWGLSGADNKIGEKYRERKHEKIQLYDSYGYDLLSIYPHHLYELDDYLPQEIARITGEGTGIWNWLRSLFTSGDTNNDDHSKTTLEPLFCINCGHQVTEIGEFCVNCGTEVSVTEET